MVDGVRSEGLLLLLGSGDPVYRGYAMQALGSEFSLALVDRGEVTWQQDHLDAVFDATPRDSSSVIAAVSSVSQKFSGVFTYDEFCVETAAAVAEELGLPQNSGATATRCRDKALMRESFHRAGVPSARSLAVRSAEQAATAADELGYPLVLKPSALAGSIGVVKVDGPDELADRFRQSTSSGHGTYGSSTGVTLVEEYLDGPEVSVEAVVRDYDVDIVAVTRKNLGPPPFFEEIGHVVAPAELLPEHDAICRVARAAHQALGVRWGATHTELRLTADGPRAVELAIRPAGDLIPLLVRLTTSVDIVTAAAAALVGRMKVPTRVAEEYPVAGVRFFYPPHDLVLEKVELVGDIADERWLWRFCQEVPAGRELRLPPRGFLDRVGFAIVTADSVVECEARLDKVATALTITGRPL